MYAAPGIGLAATQVDVHKRVHRDRRLRAARLASSSWSIPRSSRRRASRISRKAACRCPASTRRSTRAERVKVRALDQNGNAFDARRRGPARGVHPARDGSPRRARCSSTTCRRSSAAHPREARARSAQARAPDARSCALNSFAGTPEFAPAPLARLSAPGIDVALVLTQPDRPAGRGQRQVASPVKRSALERGLAFAAAERSREPDAHRSPAQLLERMCWSSPPTA